MRFSLQTGFVDQDALMSGCCHFASEEARLERKSDMPRAIENQEAETSCCSPRVPVQGLSMTSTGWDTCLPSTAFHIAGVADATKIVPEQKTKVP